MKHVVGLLFVIAACGKGGDKANEAPPPEPFKGPLTVAKIMSTKDVVKMSSDSWDSAMAKLQRLVGPPTKVDGDKHFWAAMEGDDCAYFEMRSADGKDYGKSGKVIGSLSNPEIYGKDGALMNRLQCLKLVDFWRKGITEDPNAEAPRPGGAPYDVLQIDKLASAARSKWEGQTVTITGTPVAVAGDEVTFIDPTDAHKTQSCKLDAGATAPALGKPVTMQTTIEIDERVSDDGKPVLEAKLVKCSLAKS